MTTATPLEHALQALQSDDAFALAKAKAMLIVYHEAWGSKSNDFEVLDAELEFCFPLLNPDTEGASRSFDEAGKVDVLVRNRKTGFLSVIEHKTTADSVEPDSDYWDRLRMDNQCSKYFLAAQHLNLGDVHNVIYDVMRKPGQRPCIVPERDAQGLKIVVDADGRRVMTANGKKPRETPDAEKGWALKGRQETPAEYEERLLSIMRENKWAFFAQRDVPRLDSDVLEYMGDEWAIGQQILYFRSKKLWSRNPQACKQYGACEFYDLCCGRACVDGIRFAVRQNVNTELKMQSGERQLLTNSRATAFNKCRRYHQLRYEDGVFKVDEEKEALTFGTLIHSGLEAYYKAIKAAQQ